MTEIYLNGILNRILTEENVEETWKDQIDRLVSKNGFTRESAQRICAIAEHINCIRMDETVEYVSEILKLALPYGIACDMVDLLNKRYNE